jgi:ABC-type oligopeptide transport system substrate-binding subunit
MKALALALLLVLVAACGGGERAGNEPVQAGDAAAERTALRRGNGPEPDTLDPQRARTDAAFNILRDLFEGLTAVGPDGNAVPAAAETWTVSADGLEYTFRLR